MHFSSILNTWIHINAFRTSSTTCQTIHWEIDINGLVQDCSISTGDTTVLHLAIAMLTLFFITGAMPAVTTSTFAYIADINPPEKRFIRILIIEIGLGLGTLVGQLFFGWLIEEAGFVPPVIIFTVLQFSIFIYVAFFLPETVRRKPGVRTCTSASFMTLPRLWFVGKDRMRMMTIWISFALIFVTGYVFWIINYTRVKAWGMITHSCRSPNSCLVPCKHTTW